MIVVIVNGKERQLEGPTNLQEYVESLGVNVNHIAVAHNSNVLRRQEMPSDHPRAGRPPGDSARGRRRVERLQALRGSSTNPPGGDGVRAGPRSSLRRRPAIADNHAYGLQLRYNVVQDLFVLHPSLEAHWNPSEIIGFNNLFAKLFAYLTRSHLAAVIEIESQPQRCVSISGPEMVVDAEPE